MKKILAAIGDYIKSTDKLLLLFCMMASCMGLLLLASYNNAFYGTLRGMLTLLVEQCPKENGRAKAALDYLEHSRYQDYETALAYLSDSSAVCEKQIREVLKREIQKTTALTCH